MQSALRNVSKPRGIKFLERPDVASGLLILLVNLIHSFASTVPSLDGLSIENEKALGIDTSDYMATIEGDQTALLWAQLFVYILIGIGFAYIILDIALSNAESLWWSP
jgi:hypothetical protein